MSRGTSELLNKRNDRTTFKMLTRPNLYEQMKETIETSVIGINYSQYRIHLHQG